MCLRFSSFELWPLPISKAQADVDKDAAQLGQGSHQVKDDLKKLDAAREWRAKHHADWDHGRDKRSTTTTVTSSSTRRLAESRASESVSQLQSRDFRG